MHKPSHDIRDFTDAEFRDLVDRELRKDHPSTTPEDRQYLNEMSERLRSPELLDRWIAALEIMKHSSETQLGAKRSDIQKLHETLPAVEYLSKVRTYQAWRAGTVRFLHSVQQRLIDARRLQRSYVGPTNDRIAEERNRASQACINSLRAIRSHRDHVLSEYDPTEADLNLWSTIKDIEQLETS